MTTMLKSDMKPADLQALERLANCEGKNPADGSLESGTIFVPTGRMLRVERAKALGVHPSLADQLHSSFVRLEKAGLIQKVLFGKHVTHVKYSVHTG